MKIFCAGSIGAGKTVFAENYSKTDNIPYICFDNTFNVAQSNNGNYVNEYLANLPNH